MNIDYDRCPKCKQRFPAHKGHTKTFKQLTNKEQQNSIRMMTVNLRNAIKRHSEQYNNSYDSVIRKSVRILVK